MSRLYDRIRQHGCRALQFGELFAPEERLLYERKLATDIARMLVERGDRDEGEAGIERLMKDIRSGHSDFLSRETMTVDDDLPVISADDVAAYCDRISPYYLTDIVGPLAPPFPRFFIEAQGVAPGPVMGTGIKSFGALFTQLEEFFNRSSISGSWMERGYEASSIRWTLDAQLVFEWEKGDPVGPVSHFRIPIDQEGLWFRRDGEPVWLTGFPDFDQGGGPAGGPDDVFTMEESGWLSDLSSYIAPLILTISFMHCRNVALRTVDPPERLSKKHERKTGHPLARYHVLDIEPMRRILDTEGEAQTKGLRHALHICRGHFKTFSEDAPLFGRHIGTYWWPAHVRGSAEVGAVEKDYRVRLHSGEFGQAYTEADENVTVAPAEEKPDDPDTSQRGLRAHNRTQNLLAAAVEAAGFSPRRKGRDEPNFDLAWEEGEAVWVAEVKSTTEKNEEQQMRLAIGQVIRYRQLLSEEGHEARAMIAIENAPFDESWIDLCGREGIGLVWPEVMAQALGQTSETGE